MSSPQPPVPPRPTGAAAPAPAAPPLAAPPRAVSATQLGKIGRGLIPSPASPVSAVPLTPSPDAASIVDERIDELERWAVANEKDARGDRLWFWCLTVPSVVSAAGAGIFGFFEWKAASLLIGAIGTACLTLNTLYPRGFLYNAHNKAVYDIRTLERDLRSRWQQQSLVASDTQTLNKAVAEMLDDVNKTEKMIAAELAAAEGTLGSKKSK
jgi:hypothetical protein